MTESPSAIWSRPDVRRTEDRTTTAEIRFATGQCSLGTFLVASSDKGICFMSLGDSAEELVRTFLTTFPAARPKEDGAGTQELLARIARFLDEPQAGLDSALDIRGTTFQERVWEALRQVPPGQPVSYTDLARAIGSPKAVRAVARACASNKIAVAIPCHRVIRSDGGLSGYRWGVERKQALLQREAACVSDLA